MPQGTSLVRRKITLPAAVKRELGLTAVGGPNATPTQAVKQRARAVIGSEGLGTSPPGAVAAPGGVNRQGKRCKYGVRADGYCNDRPIVPDTVIHLVRYDPRYPAPSAQGARPPGGSVMNAVVSGTAQGVAGSLTAGAMAKQIAKKSAKALASEVRGPSGSVLTAGGLAKIEANAARNQKLLKALGKGALKLLTKGK